MAQYRDYRDWSGDWDGSYDGRPASMRLSASLGLDGRRARLSVTYEAGGDTWVSEITDDFDARSHEVANQWLRPTGGSPGRQRLEWPRLHIHTWDANFISGISRWEGRDYGLWFQRRGTHAPIYIQTRRFTSWYNLDGGGDRPHNTGISWSGPPLPELCINDGRQANLAINVSPSGPNPQNDVHLDFRFIDSSGKWWRGSRVTRPWEFWINDLELNPYHHGGDPAGEGTIRWSRFYLHTWDTGQASGWSEWSGNNYGLLFHNGSPAWWT